jgi:glycosyltransferase involved in cell wall biosynthesis
MTRRVAHAPPHAPPTKIAILTGASLAFNPRAFKEAMTLARAGFAVTVVGSNWNGSRFENDQVLAREHGFVYESAIPGPRTTLAGRLRTLRGRLRGRLGREAFKHLRIENAWQLGPLPPDLLRRARSLDADYHIVHLEQASWAGCKLIRAGQRVGVDMEDWYSEDLLPQTRQRRPIRLLRSLERTLLRQAGHATCPSRAMSEALASAYACAPPAVIYNAFRWSDRAALDGVLKDRRDRSIPSIHWVSQMIGPGRGLEDLFASLPQVKHAVEIHLRGNPTKGLDAWLSACVPEAWRHRVFVHDLVSNEQLLSRIAEHDIGFAGEMRYCANKDLTISNKILHYLLAGLAVVASDTAGQREVAERAEGAAALYPSGEAPALAERLNALLGSPQSLQDARSSALRAAQQTFCWERQEEKLVTAITRAIASPLRKAA